MSDITLFNQTEGELFRSNEMFNHQWNIYQKVLNNNYLRHREIYPIMHELLVNYFQQSFTMLELGCGDASFTNQLLLNTYITSYTGIDLSEPALEIAKQNMTILPCDATFTQGDFSEVVAELAQSQQEKFHVILMSFALHHLSFNQKDELIGQLKSLLTSDGLFLLVDIVRQEEEDRETYMKRYMAVQKHWELLTPEEYLIVANHITSSDFPETQSTFQKISQKYGFTKMDCLYQDPFKVIQLLCFYRCKWRVSKTPVS